MASTETMTTEAKAGRAEGLWAPAFTVLHDGLEPDAGRTAAHVRCLLEEEGCHGVAIFGTTGEATSFSVAERKALLEAVLDSGVAPKIARPRG